MITFIKILTAPPTWKSEPIFAEPRYLIRALPGGFRLFHYRADERTYVDLGPAESRIEAERAAERHLAAGGDAHGAAREAGFTLSA